MTETDWLSLSSPEDLYGELAAVVQPRKLFQLGTAFLTRVREKLRHESQLALDATRDYLNRRADVEELLEAWTRAELSVEDGLWVNAREPGHPHSRGYGWCPCCEPPEPELDDGIHPGAREAIRDPAWFAARSAWLAIDLVTEGTDSRSLKATRRSEQVAQYPIFLDLIGDPFARPLTPPVLDPLTATLLRAISDQEDIDPLALLELADALEEGGCEDRDLLSHLRQTAPHYRGCWAVERATGREVIELPLDDTVGWPIAKFEPPRRWNLG